MGLKTVNKKCFNIISPEKRNDIITISKCFLMCYMRQLFTKSIIKKKKSFSPQVLPFRHTVALKHAKLLPTPNRTSWISTTTGFTED